MPPKDTGPFKHQEKVLVPHTDKHWEAKVVKSEKRENGMWFYLIHYPRWDKDWDEWVEEPGLRKWDQELVEREKSREAETAGPKTKGRGPASKRAEKRRKINDIAPQEAELPGESADPVVDLRLPASLKEVLVSENEALKKGLRLPPVPRKPSVMDILNQYVQESQVPGHTPGMAEKEATGLRMYFDKALHHCLLYDHEVEECQQVLSDGIMPSMLYGGEHLLRLCAKLPYLVPISSASEEGYALLQAQLAAFVDFLSQKKATFFLPPHKYVPIQAKS